MLSYKNSTKKNSFEIKVHKLVDNPNKSKKLSFDELIINRINSYYSLLDNEENNQDQTHKCNFSQKTL